MLRSRQGGRWVIDPLCNYAVIGNRLITACGVWSRHLDLLFFLSSNPSIYNIIRWISWTMGQTNRLLSVWRSNHYFFFHDFLQNSLQKSFQFIFLFFSKITKIKIECPKSIRNYEKKNTWNVRHLVNELFVPLAQQTSLLYCRLSDFSIAQPHLQSEFRREKFLRKRRRRCWILNEQLYNHIQVR